MRSICYILSYYSPDYARTRSLVKALQKINDVKLYQCRNTSKGLWRYFQTLSKLIVARFAHDPNIYILGFRGYEHYWFVRLITIGKLLIFDHMMSPYDSLVNERRRLRENGLLAKFVFLYEKLILNASDLIITDTINHKLFYQELFRIDPGKVFVVPIGTDEEVFRPIAPDIDENAAEFFEVLYFGSFLPLHGMEIIIKAAILLQDYPIRITLAGGQKSTLPSYLRMIQKHRPDNIQYLEWIEYERLPKLMARSNLGLGGPFGDTGQARRVITGKTFQFLAMAKAVVVGELNNKNINGFVDKENCLLIKQGDENALAEAILWAYNHQDELVHIGKRGFDLYHSRYSIKQISEQMQRIIGL